MQDAFNVIFIFTYEIKPYELRNLNIIMCKENSASNQTTTCIICHMSGKWIMALTYYKCHNKENH